MKHIYLAIFYYGSCYEDQGHTILQAFENRADADLFRQREKSRLTTQLNNYKAAKEEFAKWKNENPKPQNKEESSDTAKNVTVDSIILSVIENVMQKPTTEQIEYEAKWKEARQRILGDFLGEDGDIKDEIDHCDDEYANSWSIVVESIPFVPSKSDKSKR